MKTHPLFQDNEARENCMSETDRMFYAAKKPGAPGYCAGCVDDPEYAKDTAKCVADYIKRGYEVQRVTGDVLQAGFNEFLEFKKRQVKP